MSLIPLINQDPDYMAGRRTVLITGLRATEGKLHGKFSENYDSQFGL